MRTVGQILKDARESKQYTLEEVEKSTKIRKELLEALEADDFNKLPPATFVQGFIKNYGGFLKLNPDKLLALFRRDFEAAEHPPKILESFSNPVSQKKFALTPPRVLGLVIGLIILGFFIYLWVEYRQFVGAPTLKVTSPQDQQSVDIPSILVEGNTDAEVKVSVNDQDVPVDKFGHFQEEVKLSGSVSIITITATSKFGQSTRIDRTVFVKK